MDSLPYDILAYIIKDVYPTELINVCLTYRRFRHLGVDENLFKILCIIHLQGYDPNWTFTLPEQWTWKQLFIKLFNVKRQFISQMYTQVGLIYEHEYKPEFNYGLQILYDPRLSGSYVGIANRTFKCCSLLNIHIVEQGVNPLSLTEEYLHALPIEEFILNPLKKDEAILKEGLCVWHEQTNRFVCIFSMAGIINIFKRYEAIILKEYIEKSFKAHAYLNEEFNVSYTCPDMITMDNYLDFEHEIGKELIDKHDWSIITYRYVENKEKSQGGKLSLVISRYPKSLIIGKSHMSEVDSRRFASCRFTLYNHHNKEYIMFRMLQYPKEVRSNEEVKVKESKEVRSERVKADIPKVIVLDSSNENPIIGKHKETLVFTLVENETSSRKRNLVQHVRGYMEYAEDAYRNERAQCKRYGEVYVSTNLDSDIELGGKDDDDNNEENNNDGEDIDNYCGVISDVDDSYKESSEDIGPMMHGDLVDLWDSQKPEGEGEGNRDRNSNNNVRNVIENEDDIEL